MVDKDGRVKSLIVQPGPVTVRELQESFHQVGDTDPEFVPPPPLLSEPPESGRPVDKAQPEPAVPKQGCCAQKTKSVVTMEFGGQDTASSEAAPGVAGPLPQPLFEPNQNGVIVLPGRSRVSSDEGIANPFDIRLVGARSIHEVRIRFGGVVMGGERPTAMVNGRPCNAGDRWNGFNVVSVRRDVLVLERDGVFLLIPRGRETAIKIPL